MSYYQKHIFICANQKEGGKKCCAQGEGEAMSHYAKEWVSQQGLNGPGKIRVSRSGCLGRCAEGPCMVIYPEGKWYSYSCQTDIEKILRDHCLGQPSEVMNEI